MLFSSIVFLFRFLPFALFLYYISPPKLKNATLLVCSLVFYCWGEVRFFWIMLFVIVVNYVCGLLISRFINHRILSRFFLIVSIVGSLSMLFYYKYANFFIFNFSAITGLNLSLLDNLVLPLGISFYTFQSMSYSIDVYRRSVSCEKNIVNFSAYVSMFPQLIAGPIVRYTDINERLHITKGRVTPERIDEGITLFIFGLAKKVLIADNVNRLWTDIVGQYSAGTLTQPGVGLENASTGLAWLGLAAYTLYIYFDFSGYSLMGIGMGKMLGFDFPMNFNLPYISRSVTEFWRRWHITLSSWFREYVYIPLGGNRKGRARQVFNLCVIWLLTGFWHGANWNFILWGVYYAILLIIEKNFLLDKLQKGRVWPHLYTIFIFTLGWGLFVGSDPGVNLSLLMQKLFTFQDGVGALYFLRNYAAVLALGILFSSPLPEKLWTRIKENVWARGGVLAVLLLLSVAYMEAGGYSPFLYFNF